MRARVAIFKSDGKVKEGFPVKLILSHDRSVRRKTVGYASRDNWDELKNVPRPSHPDFEFLYGLILDCEKNNIRNSFRSMSNFDQAFEIFLGREKKPMLITEYFRIQEQRLRDSGREGTAINYGVSRRRMAEFAPNASLSDIDVDFVQRYRYSLEGLSDSYIRTLLNRLKALYNKALLDPDIHLEDTNPFRNASKGLHVKVRRKKNRYLDDKNLKLVMDLEKEGDLLDSERMALRMSLLQFYFGGLNFIDLFYLKKSAFYGDRVLLSRRKLGRYREEFDVRVFDPAREIIEKIGENDSEYLIPSGKSYGEYKIFYSLQLKRLVTLQKRYQIELAPMDQLLNTNSFRHTFATRAKFQGVDSDIIRELMGHERNDIDTAYKDRFPEDIRDEAHLKIITITS